MRPKCKLYRRSTPQEDTMKFLSFAILLVAVIGCASSSDTESTSSPAGTAAPVEVKLQEVGLSWKLPSDWKLLVSNQGDYKVYYVSPGNAGLFAVRYTVMTDEQKAADMGQNEKTTPEQDIQTFYEGALKGQDDGRNQDVRLTTVGGVPGIEFESVSKPDKREFIFETCLKKGGQEYYVVTNVSGTGDLKDKPDQLNAILHSMTQIK